jgi:hypothetical protein
LEYGLSSTFRVSFGIKDVTKSTRPSVRARRASLGVCWTKSIFLIFGVEFPQAAFFEEVVVVITDVEPTFVLGDDPILEPKTGIPGIEVHLPHGSGVITGLG